MSQEVPNLYDNLNLTTLPKIIIDEFNKLGYWHAKDMFIKPYFSTYTFNLENENLKFHTHGNTGTFTKSLIRDKRLLNESYELVTQNEFHEEYIKEYGKGFYKGYTNYSNELKNKGNQIFEPDNKQLAYKIFSKVIIKKGLRVIDNFPFTFIPIRDTELVNQKHKGDVIYCYALKEQYNNAGFKSGEKYKAWELILHNPTLFEDIFIEQLGKPEPKEELITETPDLSLKNIPSFNLQQRYYLFTKLHLDKIIHKIEVDKQSSKHKILALLMGISPDNAKHVLNNSYTKLSTTKKEEVDEYLLNNNIKL